MTTPETSVRYAERFRLLSCMAAREVMQDADAPIALEAIVRWLSDRRASLRSASWRQYRCAIDHHCKTALDLDEETRKDLLKSLYGKSDPETIAARKALSPATSSHVLKRLLDSEWDKLLDSLKRGLAGNSVYDTPLLTYLEAGRATGLRPCEWARVRLVTFPGAAVSVLVVKNAKEDEVRAHGDFRRLVFAHETCGASLMAIRRWLAIVDSSLAGTVGGDRAPYGKNFTMRSAIGSIVSAAESGIEKSTPRSIRRGTCSRRPQRRYSLPTRSPRSWGISSIRQQPNITLGRRAVNVECRTLSFRRRIHATLVELCIPLNSIQKRLRAF